MRAQILLGVWEALTLSGGHIMGMHDSTLESHQPLRPSQIADLRLAASQMTGPKRRAFQAEMALKYCGGTPLLAETIFGWGRHTVEVGLAARHRDPMSRCAIGLQRSQTLGKNTRIPRQRKPRQAGGSACATSPNISTSTGLYAADGPRGSGRLARPRLWRGAAALTQYDGRGAESSGLSAAQSSQSQTTKKDC
jgi:hypothetical protein